MQRLFNASLIALCLSLFACSSQIDMPYKGPELDSLAQAANYFQARALAKKLLMKHIVIQEQPFLLGAYDVRDDIPARVSEESYAELLETLQKSPPQAPAASPDGLSTAEERTSYLSARALAKSFGKNGIPVMPLSMALGLKDAQAANIPPRISAKEEQELRSAITAKINHSNDDWAENRKSFYRSEERNFFAENIVRPGVMALDSGVQYKLLRKGTGKLPKLKDTIQVHYRGTLLDGTEFDSSYSRGKADSFKLSDMIAGFSQAMTQVPDGSKVLIYIPSRLAYGEKGTQGIPPDAAVVFEVELNSIKSGFF